MHVFRLLVAVVAVIVAADACVHEPPADPRAADRARLDAVADTPLPPDFPAEARLVLSSQLMALEVQQSLDDAARTVEAFRFALPLLGEVALRPQLVVRGVRAEPEPSCTACVALVVDLDGALSPVTASGLLPGLRFAGAARGVFALRTVDVADAGVIEIRATGEDGTDVAGRHGWAARLSLVDLPPGLSAQVSQSVTDFLQRLMASDARPDLLLASLPREGPVRLRGLRPSARDGAVVVDVAFVAIDAGIVDDALPAVTDGFALQLPEQTLLALARAETLRLPPEDGWVVDPASVVVDGDRFALDLAVYKLAGRIERRDVRVDGVLQIDGTTLSITPTAATQLARSGGFDPFELIVRTALLQKVEESLRLAVPVAQAAPMGGRTRRARLVGIRDLGATLQVDGVVDAPAGR
jgi:hypothetical protein